MRPAAALLLSCLLSLVVGAPAVHAQGSTGASQLSADAIRELAADYSDDALALYREFLRFPNDAHHPDDILAMVEWMEDQFADLGFSLRRLETPGSPLLLAERDHGAATTVLVYLQSDGQPVAPWAWDQDNPFEPVLKAEDTPGSWRTLDWSELDGERDPDWRIFARSASDSKGPMTQFMTALSALNAINMTPDYNLKVIIDTEEEMGSPHLPQAVIEHRDALAADMLMIFDGPPHVSNEPTVKFGARGIMTLTLVTYGPRAPLHSGHYGNFVPNPALGLARLLTSMKAPDGRVVIDGFYDGVELTDDVRAILAAVPDDEAGILAAAGVAAPDRVADSLQESVQYPSLNIRGLQSGWVGREVRTIVPATATAEIDVRLVKESDPDYLLGLIRKHIEDEGYVILDGPPTDAERRAHPRLVSISSTFSYAAFRTDFDAPPGLLARGAMRHLYGEEPILIRTSGGSIPISPFVDTLGIPAASYPTVNGDNNQHSPNENIRLGNFLDGVAMMIAILAQRIE